MSPHTWMVSGPKASVLIKGICMFMVDFLPNLGVWLFYSLFKLNQDGLLLV